MRRRMRTLGLAGASALAAVATAACSPLPIACPAVGYSSTLTVALAEPRDDVALELCVTAGCEPMPLDDLASEGIGFGGGGDGDAGWSVELSPETVVGYRLLAADGSVVADGEVEPDWVRVGGSEQCGGPTAAEVVLG